VRQPYGDERAVPAPLVRVELRGRPRQPPVVVAKDFLCPHGQPLVPHEHTSLEDLDLHRLISLRSAHPFFSDALRRGEREAGMLLDQKPAPGPGCTFRPKPLRFP
jgi:hypothetical protein